MAEQQFTILADPIEGAAIAQILARIGHGSICLPPDSLIEQVEAGRITALFADAPLLAAVDIDALKRAIATQPPWSDLPILLLVDRDQAPRYVRLMDELGQVRLLERPIHPFIIERSALAALRSRTRQASARATVEAARRAEAELRELSDTLEARVAERGAELRSAYAELAHVSRLGAMGAMASTLAHELNQPLTAVVNYLRGSRRLLEAGPGQGPEQARHALERAEESARRAGDIIRRLRDLVERGDVERKRESLPELIEEASVIGFVDAASRGIDRRFAFDPDARWVQADRVQVQQVLINLIRNAVEAMASEPRREVTIATARRGDRIEVSVADTGPGIAPEVGGDLFTPFATTKEEGMGIGLSISRTIVEAHGGRIWAERAPGGGALFRFTLPRAPRSAAEESEPVD